jgi:predicted DNA-binding protein (UPF0251 family)
MFRKKNTQITLTDLEASTLLNACRLAREGKAREIDQTTLKSAFTKLGDAFIEGNSTIKIEAKK